MDLLKDSVTKAFRHYFLLAFGGAFLGCIYGMVDSAVVGQYGGPLAAASMSVVMPVFCIMFSLGLMTGLGGSVLFAHAKGVHDLTEAKKAYTVSFFTALIVGSILSCLVIIYCEPLLRFFGANDEIMPYALDYFDGLKWAIPLYMVGQTLTNFLRNDDSPGLTTIATIGSGAINAICDYVFVFTFDLGAKGAGLATSLGSYLQVLITLGHFLRHSHNLHFVAVDHVWRRVFNMVKTGFPIFVVDLSIGYMTILMNRRLLYLLGTDAVAIYSALLGTCMFADCCAYSVGNAAQPILSQNYAARQFKRVKKAVKLSLMACFGFGITWMTLTMLVPNAFVRIFMDPTEQLLAEAPGAIRLYALALIILPFNIFATFYFQSILRPKVAFWLSLGRGWLLSALCIFVLPALFGSYAIWLAIPVSETLIGLCGLIQLTRSLKNMSLETETA